MVQAVTLIDFDKHTLRFKIWPSPLEPSVLTLIMTILPLVTKSLMHRGGEPLVFASTENLRAETAGSSAKNASRRKLTVRMAMYVIQIEYGLGCRQDEWGSDGRINWRWRRQEVRKGSWIYWYFFFFKNGLLWIVYFFFRVKMTRILLRVLWVFHHGPWDHSLRSNNNNCHSVKN